MLRYVVGTRRLMPPDALHPKAYCTNPSLWYFLLTPPGVSTRDPCRVKEELLEREMAYEFCLKIPDFHVTFRDLTSRKSTTWDKRLYLPSEGRRAEDFFALKNPTASAGFEPANLGTKGQHAISRPPKPLVRK